MNSPRVLSPFASLKHSVLLCSVVLCSSLLGQAPQRPSSSLVPVHLEVESRVDPVGVDRAHPRLSWQLAARSPESRGVSQRAYRILVSSSAQRLSRDAGDVWDSGRMNSALQLGVPFAGAALQPETPLFWKVRTWDQDDRPSPWSLPAQWTSGMMEPAAWKAHWIAASAEEPPPPPARETDRPQELPPKPLPLFRRDFPLKRHPVSALVAVSGMGQYELRVNGANVTQTVLNPGWTNYRKRVLYNMYDVTSLLRSGPNTLGVMLGNGMYDVPAAPGRYTKFTGSFGQPKFILQMIVRYDDGTSTTITSDRSWRSSPGPITFSSIYGGEDFDARSAQPGWETPAFRPGSQSWRPAVEVPGPGGVLEAQLLQPVIVAQTLTPISVTHPDDRTAVYDLGKNFSGWPSIVVRGPAGSTVKLLPGELLDARGRVTQASNDARPGRENSFTYTLRGSGSESWHPQFSYNGFRYVEVQVTPAPGGPELPLISSVSGSFLHDGVAVTGEFESSQEQFVQIHNLIGQAILSNMFSVLTDCPTREKLGWLEQTHLAATSIMYNFDVRRLYEKIAGDMADAQTASGLVPAIAPEFVAFVDKNGRSTDFRDSPEWGSAAILSPLAAFRFYGDPGLLSEHLDTMQRYAAYLGSRTRDHLLDYGLGDWYDIGPGKPGVSQLTTKGLTATAIYYQDLLAMAEIEDRLGHAEQARPYAAEAVLVKEAFNRKFFHPETGQYDRGSQTANAMPLALGLVPPVRHDEVLAALVADIRAHANHVTSGDIGFHYLVRALTDSGRSDVLADMLLRTDAPSYGYQLAHGATSLTEAWDSGPTHSQNHFMLGHAEEWFYRGLAGIDLDLSRPEPDALVIRPTLIAGIDHAGASIETVYGTFSSHWKRVPGGTAYDISLPAGHRGTVLLKVPVNASVSEGGHPLAPGDGILKVSRTGDSLVCVLGSGSYRFFVAE